MPLKGEKGLRVCEVCGISSNNTRVSRMSKTGMVLCAKHYQQFLRNGHVLSETVYDKNKIIVNKDYAEIELKDKKSNVVGYAIIDLDDVEKCSKYKWCIRKNPNMSSYAITRINNKVTFLHRFVMNFNGENNMVIDHINRNGLDNRKNNLRIVTQAVNAANKGCKGYNKRNNRNSYTACFTRDKKYFYLGDYDSPEEAKKIREYELSIYEQNPIEYKNQYDDYIHRQHGVSKINGKWTAYIYKDNIMYNGGRYDTYEEAVKARKKLEKVILDG